VFKILTYFYLTKKLSRIANYML